MTVEELRDELAKYPNEMPVVVADWENGVIDQPEPTTRRAALFQTWQNSPKEDFLMINGYNFR